MPAFIEARRTAAASSGCRISDTRAHGLSVLLHPRRIGEQLEAEGGSARPWRLEDQFAPESGGETSRDRQPQPASAIARRHVRIEDPITEFRAYAISLVDDPHDERAPLQLSGDAH